MTDQPKSLPDSYRLLPSADGRRIQFVYEPGTEALPVDSASVLAKLEAAGYGEWVINREALTKLSKLVREAKSSLKIDVAQKQDAELSVKLSNDEMTALLTVSPPRGGSPITDQDIRVLLDRNKVVYGIQDDVIATIVSTQTAEQIPVANGTAPISGEDTRFEGLLPEISDRRPKQRDDGTVDYRDIGLCFTVTPETLLMQRIPPTIGTAGTSITGKVIPAKPGRELGFAAPLVGVMLDAEDKNYLRASIGGQPVLIEHGVRVEPVINFKEIDLSTGNIEFDGTVNVAGNVIAGLSIRTSGDIFVAGMVEGATLEAGGSIKVAKGVIGRGEVRNDAGELNTSIARIRATGPIQTRFFENAWIESGADVLADELVAHCEISAKGAVVVGKDRAKKGHILGGNIFAEKGIKAQVIGSASGVRGKLEAGISRSVRTRLVEVRDTLITKCAERDKLATVIGRAAQLPKDMAARVRATFDNAEQDIKALQLERDALQKEIETDVNARITVGLKAFEGNTLLLGERSMTIEQERGPGIFTLAAGEIVFTPG